MPTPSNLVQTIIGGATAICIAAGGLYTIAILPIKEELKEAKTLREDDRKQLVALYLSIQTNDEYKKFAEAERTGLRRDLDKVEHHILRIELTQQQRTTAVSSVPSIEKRIDRLDARNEEQDRRSAPTIIEEVKTLRSELENLRQRIMVPVSSK